MATEKGYFSSIDSNDIKGGLYQVDSYLDIFKLNAATHFKDGMLCYVSNRDTYYQYNAKKHRWYAMDLHRADVVDTSVFIDGEWWSITMRDNYDDLVQEIVHLKYSDTAQQNLDGDMRMYPELYQDQEDAYQYWFTLSKEAAWNLLYADSSAYDMANREGDESKIFNYPVLKAKLDELYDNVSYLYLCLNPLQFKVTVNSGAATEYNGKIYVDITDSAGADAAGGFSICVRGQRAGGDVGLMELTVKSLWDDSVIYTLADGDGSDIPINIDATECGTYELEITGSDNNKEGGGTTCTQTIVLTTPYFFGCSGRDDINENNDETRTDDYILQKITDYLHPYSKCIDADFDLVLLRLTLGYCGITWEIFQEALADMQATYQITVNEDEFGLLTNLTSLYSMLLKKAKAYLDGVDLAAGSAAGLDEADAAFFSLDGIDEGVKWLWPQEKLTINNMNDGNFMWICIPTPFYTGELTVYCDGFYFPLATPACQVTTSYGDYTCLRSIGPKGIEAGTLNLTIEY